MKRLHHFPVFFLLPLSVFWSAAVFSQCSVTIQPPGPLALCEGDSVILTALSTGSSSIIDQSQLNSNAGTSARNLPGYSHWQSFTAGQSGILTQLDLGFFNFISGTGTLSFYQGTGTAGIQLSTQTVTVSCPGGNCLLSFTVNVPVTAGQAYTLHFIPGPGIPDPYGVQVENPGTYPGGYFTIVDPSGSYPTAFDMLFQTHVSPPAYLLWSDGSTLGTVTVQSEGWYSVIVTDSAGCTDTDSIFVTVHDPDTSVLVAGNILSSVDSGAAWQWVDCANGYAVIPGETNQSFQPLTGGSFAVVVTDNGCSDTSSCYTMNFSGFPLVSHLVPVHIFPNPSDDLFYIPDLTGKMEVAGIFNLWGRKLNSCIIQKTAGGFQIHAGSLPCGIYVLWLKTGAFLQPVQIIRN